MSESSPISPPTLKGLELTFTFDNRIAILSVDVPAKKNAVSFPMLGEIEKACDFINDSMDNEKYDIRCLILTGKGANFTSGLDVKSAQWLFEAMNTGMEVARHTFRFFNIVNKLQRHLLALENLRVPVICAMNGYSIGMAVDLATASDIRICSKNAKFTVKEIDIGICADLSTV
mmetsp:Transcript_8463/g.6010  ORF Transcript_8463/g.6010 Transcript_8463/m.6010 type:complete len:174 (-) Transcript_8463:387-908(-)